MSTAVKPSEPVEVTPDGFRVDRELPVGRHPLLRAFPGLDGLPPAARLVRSTAARRRLFGQTSVELVPEDVWMYIAPHERPSGARSQWRPVLTAPGSDCIVVGENHLRTSPSLMLFMDIYHELCHVLQRRAGAELWPPGVSYVRRWTEVEAYRFVVNEARRFGVTDEYLREYLRVEWISDDEHRELLRTLAIAPE